MGCIIAGQNSRNTLTIPGYHRDVQTTQSRPIVFWQSRDSTWMGILHPIVRVSRDPELLWPYPSMYCAGMVRVSRDLEMFWQGGAVCPSKYCPEMVRVSCMGSQDTLTRGCSVPIHDLSWNTLHTIFRVSQDPEILWPSRDSTWMGTLHLPVRVSRDPEILCWWCRENTWMGTLHPPVRVSQDPEILWPSWECT